MISVLTNLLLLSLRRDKSWMQQSDEKIKIIFEVINYCKEQRPYYTNAHLGYTIYLVCVCILNSSAVWIMFRSDIFTEIKKRISNIPAGTVWPSLVPQEPAHCRCPLLPSSVLLQELNPPLCQQRAARSVHIILKPTFRPRVLPYVQPSSCCSTESRAVEFEAQLLQRSKNVKGKIHLSQAQPFSCWRTTPVDS